MAHQLQSTQEDAFLDSLDMESMSETDQMLQPSARQGGMLPRSWSRGAVMAAVLIGTAVACTVGSFALKKGPKASTSGVVSLQEESTDEVWASLLSGSAMDQYQSQKAEADTTPEPTEPPTEPPTVAPTEPPTEAPTEVPTQAQVVVAAPVAPAPVPAPAPSTAAPATAVPMAPAPVAPAPVAPAPVAPAPVAPPPVAPAPVAPAPVAPAPVAPAPVAPAPVAPATVAAATVAGPAPGAVTPTTAPASQADSMKALAKQMQQEAASYTPDSAKYKQLMRISDLLISGSQKVADAAQVAVQVPTLPPVAPVVGAPTSTTEDPLESPLAPNENVGDGNPCPDDEEMTSGICYKKCADLTGGSHPVRTSPFSCCTQKPCGFSNTWTHMGFCFGYDIAGDQEAAKTGSKCPESPGACLTDEEDFNNMCYESCAKLTNNEYPHRVAAATCCKTKGVGCFLFTNIKTDAAFAAGGGAGDGNSGTPATGHPPLTSLTR